MPIAYLILNVKLGHEKEIINRIKTILEKEKLNSFEVQGVFGNYDIVVKLSADTNDELRKVALKKIRPIDNIQSAITMMVSKY